jgi:hypothetical protein
MINQHYVTACEQCVNQDISQARESLPGCRRRTIRGNARRLAGTRARRAGSYSERSSSEAHDIRDPDNAA